MPRKPSSETQLKKVSGSVPPTFMPQQELSSQNASLFAMGVRRMREFLQDAQSKRADGKLTIEMGIRGGQITGIIRYRPDWCEHIGPDRG